VTRGGPEDRPSSGPPLTTTLPEGFGIVLDPGTRVLEGGTLLVGGTPTRLLRLTAAGARIVADDASGEPLPDDAARSLARRLVDARLAHPRPPAGALPRAAITVVVPVRDRASQLDRCLASLDAAAARVLVVDDGSSDGAAIGRVAARHGADVVRHETSRGASAARNSGIARSTTQFVAFVDSDCVGEPGWLDAVAAHLADPRVAAAAPRIVAARETRDTTLGRFEAERSPIDMGEREGAVAPISRIPYVPSAALVVRRAALPAGGFDQGLSIGEDIDLVWRMIEAGWSVRYDPAIAVAHDHRNTLRPWLARRFVYGTSAAALAVRHRASIPVAVLTPWSAAAWTLLAARRPVHAVAAAAVGVAVVHASVGPRALPLTESARLAAIGLGWSGWSLAVALTRSWLPVTALAAARSRGARRFLLAASVLPRAVGLRRAAPGLPLALSVPATAADDAAYAAGLWSGCLRARTAAPLVPSVRLPRRRGTPTR
jgi:mycofactocin system glycosyltransferase